MLRNSLIVMVRRPPEWHSFAAWLPFVFAHVEFRGKSLAFNLFTVGLMFPITVAILPVYLVLRQMGLTDHLEGVILIQIAFLLSTNILILRSSFLAIPIELQDASLIDGCSIIGFFWLILMPLSSSPVSSRRINHGHQLERSAVPLVVLIRIAYGRYLLARSVPGSLWSGPGVGGGFVNFICHSSLVFYFIAERQIVSGLTAGALKG